MAKESLIVVASSRQRGAPGVSFIEVGRRNRRAIRRFAGVPACDLGPEFDCWFALEAQTVRQAGLLDDMGDINHQGGLNGEQ